MISEREARSEAEQQATRSDAPRAYPHSQRAPFEEPLANKWLRRHEILDEGKESQDQSSGTSMTDQSNTESTHKTLS